MMNNAARIKMVRAMEYIARQVNDEDVFDLWLSAGVADGDIQYGRLDIAPGDGEDLDYYTRDDEFARLMDTFLALMKNARKSGGLYCDGIVSAKE